MKKSLTLVVAVYNAARFLELILAALERQSTHDFEVIIADDGSGPEVRQLLQSAVHRLPFPLKHLWQPDEGFRKNMMLNKAIAASETDYLVFIDGDCLPHHKFIEDHRNNRMSNAILCGRRVFLSRQMTEKIQRNEIVSGKYERLNAKLLLDGLRGGSRHLEEGIRIENPTLRKVLHRKPIRMLGCNFSLEKSLLERINGFNEDYKAPGLGEDSDVAHRLSLIGARFVDLRHLALLYHLYHPRTVEAQENWRIYTATLASQDPVCRNGLRKIP